MAESTESFPVIYEVSASVRADLVEEWKEYMKSHHLPDMLATGCFNEARLMSSDSGTFRSEYVVPNRAALERYLTEHAALLRPHAKERFPEGITFEREVWCQLTVVGKESQVD